MAIAQALLSLLATTGNAQYYCEDASASAIYTLIFPGAPAIACGAACSASFIAVNAAKAANVTACNKAVADAKTACDSFNTTCANGATAQKNACDTMLQYVQATSDDSIISQTLMTCIASTYGTTACNAAWSASYISCHVAHTTDYTSCNIDLNEYVALCVTQETSVSECNDAFTKARESCQSSALEARNSCTASATKAQSSC